jgi:predicted small lipoprotein YifL
MKNVNKSMLMAALLVSLAACGRKDAEKTADAAPVVPDAASVATNSIVPAVDGVQPADVLKFSAAAATKAPCELDVIGGKPAAQGTVTLPQGAATSFSGWIANPDLKTPDAFAIALNGTEAYLIRAAAGAARPDVARVLKQDGLKNAGYNVSVKLDGIASGEYTISLVQDWQGSAIQCPTKGKLLVTGS